MNKHLKNIENCVEGLETRGYYLHEKFASKNECLEIINTLKLKPYEAFNNNELKPTIQGFNIYNKHAIAISEAAFNVVTSNWVIDISEKFLGTRPILKCSRSYSVSKFDQSFRWHTDNKSNDEITDKSRGIVFILFLEDDPDGSFALVEGFKNPPNSKCKNPTFNEIEAWKDKNLIKNFYAKRGDLLAFSQDMFHEHINYKNIDKNAFWFQVIGFDEGIGERILINSSFLNDNFDKKKMDFISSTNRRNEFSFPITTIKSMSFSRNVIYLFILFLYLPKTFVSSLKYFLKAILPNIFFR